MANEHDRAVHDRILDAAVEAAAVHGVTRLSVADVAKRAGMSRPTLYKHFATKDVLVSSAVLREVSALQADVLAAAERHDDPLASLEAGVLEALHLTREHPLLDRIICTEPEVLVPFLTTDASPVIGMVRSMLEPVIASRLVDLDEVACRRLADMLTRLMISYALSAPDDPPEVVAAAIAHFLVHGATTTTMVGSHRTPEDP